MCALPQIGCAKCTNCRAGRPHRCDKALSRDIRGNLGTYTEFVRIDAQETFRLPDSVRSKRELLLDL